jgi:hypothetical protein
MGMRRMMRRRMRWRLGLRFLFGRDGMEKKGKPEGRDKKAERKQLFMS